MAEEEKPRPSGVLNPKAGARRFDESLQPPSPDLAEIIQHCWAASWDLEGLDPYPQHLLPHPSINLVIEKGAARIHGVTTGRFTYVFEGKGVIFGIAFRPAGFRPLLGSRVSVLTNRVVAAADVFGHPGDELSERIVSPAWDRSRMVEAAEDFVRSRLPAPDPGVDLVNRIMDQVRDDRTITRVDDLASRTGLGERTLQRLFGDYVGVSPKWVIRRYRLLEAADRLADNQDSTSQAWPWNSATSIKPILRGTSRNWWGNHRPNTCTLSATLSRRG
jgi:AraC-like DNA-binding protein